MLKHPVLIDDIHERIDGCTVCETANRKLSKPLAMRRGPATAIVMAIGVAPSHAAQTAALAFAGSSFLRLSKWFELAGFPGREEQLRKALYLTSLNKCAVTPDNASNRRALWTKCQTFLWAQLEAVRPQLVLLLGREPSLSILPTGRGTPQMSEMAGMSWTTRELFGLELFPKTEVDCTWLVLPHPSGLSRTMNDPVFAQGVIEQLSRHLTRINFKIPQDQP